MCATPDAKGLRSLFNSQMATRVFYISASSFSVTQVHVYFMASKNLVHAPTISQTFPMEILLETAEHDPCMLAKH